MGKRFADLGAEGAQKRANYWLGDKDAQLVLPEEDMDDGADDGLYWNRGEDGDIVSFLDEEFVDDFDDDDEMEDDDDRDMLDTPRERFMSEDIAGRMDL